MSATVEHAVEASLAAKKKRILLVEDDSTSRLFLFNQLKKRGLEVDTAPNGSLALLKIKSGGFDAVILDLMLPDVRGKDLIKQIRKTKPGADIPIFVVTSAQRMDLWRKRGTKAGATRVIDKAAPVEKIAAEIVNFLIPKPKQAPAPEKASEPERNAASDTAPGVTTGFVPVAASGPPKAHQGDSGGQAVRAPVAGVPKTQTRNTALFRKIKEAGRAARATPPPPPSPTHAGGHQAEEQTVINEPPDVSRHEVRNRPALSADTPLLFGELAEENTPTSTDFQVVSVPPTSSEEAPIIPIGPPPPPETDQPSLGDVSLADASPAAVPVSPDLPVEAPKDSPAPAAPANAGQLPSSGTPPVVTQPASESTRSRSYEVRELEEQLAEVRRNRDELALLLRDRPMIGSAAAPDAAMQKTLDEAKAAAQCAEAAYQAEFLRAREFEEELTRIREARDELNRKLAEEEQAAAEARLRSEEMEQHLAQGAAQLEQTKAELQKSIAERSALEVELREQVSGARQSADSARVAYEEQAAKAQRLGEELETLRKAREDLNARLNAEMQAAAESKRRMAECELQLREKEAEVERLKNELKRHATDKNLSKKLSAAQVAAENAQAVYKEEAARGAHSKKQLARLNKASEELNTRLAEEEKAAEEAGRRSEEMERQLAERNSELNRLKSDLQRHADERKALEEQFQQQLAQARDASARARREPETRVIHRSTEEVDALRRARDELNARLEREQQAAVASRRHSEDVESKLQAATQELARLRAELEKQANQRAMPATATPVTAPPVAPPPPPAPRVTPPPPPAVARTADTAPPAEAARRPGLAERIIAPFRIFSGRAENPAIRALEEQLAEVTRNRDELLVLLRDRPMFSFDTATTARASSLNEAKAATKRAEASYQAELARSRQFEEELKRIRETRDELNRKLAEEEKAAEESRRRSQELEDRLVQSAGELEQAKAELQGNIAEHSALERDLRRQLESSRQFAESTKLAFEKQAALTQRSLEELTALRNARDELNARVNAEAQAAAGSKQRTEEREQQLRTREAEVERLKAALGPRAADKDLSKKLTEAQAAAQKAQTAYQEEAARGAQFEQELRRLQQARQELNTRLAHQEQAGADARRRQEEMEQQLAARTAELGRLKSELQRHGEERKALEGQLQQQVTKASNATQRVRKDFEQETQFFHRSTEGVDALRKARDEVNARLEREQQATLESRRHSEELEGKLQAAGQELVHLRAELERRTNERADLVTASSRQMQAVRAAAEKAEKAYKEQLKRGAKFEQELAAIRKDRTLSDEKADNNRGSAAKASRKVQELEKRAAAHAEDLEKARAEFEQRLRDRQRLECQHSAGREESEGSSGSTPADGRFQQSVNALAHVTVQLEKERSDRRRVEERATFLTGQLKYLQEELRKHLEVEAETQQRIAEFEDQLREREAELAKIGSDFQKETAARQLVQAQLKASGDMGDRFQEQSDLLDEAKRVFNTGREELQARLETALAAGRETEAKLQRQISERKRVEELLEDTQRQLEERSQHEAAEIARLQSALELETIERRRHESQSLQSQFASVDASRLGHAFVNSFRAHLRPAANHVLARARRLLVLPLEGREKELLEAALESALVLQTSMQDNAALPGEPESKEAA